ncbi:hypothetical protein IWX81_001295 [Salinibacterium sp. CAN_S4]
MNRRTSRLVTGLALAGMLVIIAVVFIINSYA